MSRPCLKWVRPPAWPSRGPLGSNVTRPRTDICWSAISRFILFLLIAILQPTLHSDAAEPGYQQVLPGYPFSFPKDHAAHEAYRTEWWYYTGHLESEDGRTLGYQLTFFRSGMDHPLLDQNPSRWAIHQLYLAHFAITDQEGKRFHFAERVNRAGVGQSGALSHTFEVWNGDWTAMLVAPPELTDPTAGGTPIHHIKASDGDWAIDLWLRPSKPVVIHGSDGVSKKGAGITQASHYYSLTRLETRGTVRIPGSEMKVNGSSWMDHEFGSNQLAEDQMGWDWFGLQLDQGTELMLYQIRRRDGSVDPYSGGTIILSQGETQTLTAQEFQIEATGSWVSPAGGARYPSGWRISIPSRGFKLTLIPTLPNQELITARSSGITYWEGSVKIHGNQGREAISGKGYVELTGYAEPITGAF